MDENPDIPTESEIKDIEKLLSKVKKEVSKPRKRGKALSIQEKQHLSNNIARLLSEYVDCYILFGFDVHGNSTVLINTANNMESRALADLVDDFMSSGQWMPGMYQKEDSEED